MEFRSAIIEHSQETIISHYWWICAMTNLFWISSAPLETLSSFTWKHRLGTDTVVHVFTSILASLRQMSSTPSVRLFTPWRKFYPKHRDCQRPDEWMNEQINKAQINIVRSQTKSAFACTWTLDDSLGKSQKKFPPKPLKIKCHSQATGGLFGLQVVFVSEMNVWNADMDVAHMCEVTISLFCAFTKKDTTSQLNSTKVWLWFLSPAQGSVHRDSTGMWQPRKHSSKYAGGWSYVWFGLM